MKKLIYIAVMVTLAACSNETSTTSTDSTSVDSIATDSLIESSEAHADSLYVEVEKLKSDN